MSDERFTHMSTIDLLVMLKDCSKNSEDKQFCDDLRKEINSRPCHPMNNNQIDAEKVRVEPKQSWNYYDLNMGEKLAYCLGREDEKRNAPHPERLYGMDVRDTPVSQIPDKVEEKLICDYCGKELGGMAHAYCYEKAYGKKEITEGSESKDSIIKPEERKVSYQEALNILSNPPTGEEIEFYYKKCETLETQLTSSKERIAYLEDVDWEERYFEVQNKLRVASLLINKFYKWTTTSGCRNNELIRNCEEFFEVVPPQSAPTKGESK